jgi:plastocyanin
MTDWDLLLPGIGLTALGIAGVGLSLAGIAATFLEGMHAVSLLAMFIGMIFLAQGLFKDGFPSSPRAKSASFIVLGFLVTLGIAATISVATRVPSIYSFIILMVIIFIPVSVLAVASYKRTPYLRYMAVILIGISIAGGSLFYASGLIIPKSAEKPVQNSSATTSLELPKGAPIVKVTILAGASAKGNPNFDPKILNVPKGAGIIWTNNDNVPHTVTSFKDTGKSFDSSIIMPKKTFTLNTAKLSGKEYDYFCTIHPFMKAKFNIQ